MLSLLFPFGKLAICYCPRRRYAMERKDQGLGRGPWWVAGNCISWQLVSPSSEYPCQVVFELVTSSQKTDVLLCTWSWQHPGLWQLPAVSRWRLCWLEHQEVLVLSACCCLLTDLHVASTDTTGKRAALCWKACLPTRPPLPPLQWRDVECLLNAGLGGSLGFPCGLHWYTVSIIPRVLRSAGSLSSLHLSESAYVYFICNIVGF